VISTIFLEENPLPTGEATEERGKGSMVIHLPDCGCIYCQETYRVFYTAKAQPK